MGGTMRSTAEDLESSVPSQRSSRADCDRYSQRRSQVLLRIGVFAGLACLASIAVLGFVRQDDTRPIEDYIIGAPTASSPSTGPPSAASGQYPTWIRDAVEKAVGNAAKEARADLKNVVKTAVTDAVEDTIKSDKKMSGMSLVSKMIRNSAKEGAAVAKKESAQYDADFKQVANTISKQIDSLMDSSAASFASSAAASAAAGSSTSPTSPSGSAASGHRGRHGPLQKQWVKIASEVLKSQDAETAVEKQAAAAKEKANEEKEYKEEQREYHLLEKGIKHQTQAIRAGHPVIKQKTVPLYDPKAEQKADAEASTDLKKLKTQLPQQGPTKTFHESEAMKARKAREEAKAAALAKTEEKRIDKTTDKVFPGMKGVTLQTKEVSDGNGKHKIPVSSKQNPKYIAAENKRNKEAQEDFKTLNRLRKLKKLVEEKKKLQQKAQMDSAEDRTAMAEKYLKVMEAKEKANKAKAHTPVDRTALAEHYLHRLEKKGKAFFNGSSKKIPPTSRHAPAYREAQEQRDEEAKRDMKLLKKGVALVKHGSAVVPVKLSPAVVHGVNKVAKERKQLHRPRGPDRNKLAQEFLHQLSKEPHAMTHVGKPFHGYQVPRKMLHPARSDMNAKAQRYLKMLQAANPKPPPPPPPPSRSLIAQKDLKSLEHQIGHAPTPKFNAAKPVTADTLAERDLQTLKKYPAPKTNPK